MTIFADECVYQVTVDLIRSWGFSVITVQEAGLTAYKNGKILAHAQQQQFIFLTRDKDFTDIRIYPPSSFKGLIVLKISPANQDEVHQVLQKLLTEVSLTALDGKLVLVDRKKYRIVG